MSEFESLEEGSEDFGSQAIDVVDISSKHYRFMLDSDIDEPAVYRKLILTLLKATKRDVIDFIVNSDGGCMFIMGSIIEAFKISGIRTRAIVVGKCYSAASMLSLSCDEIEFRPSGEMMIHTAQLTGHQGPTRNVERKAKFDRQVIETILDRVYANFLSKGELEDVKEYKEVWLTSEQVNKRLKKWRKAKKA